MAAPAPLAPVDKLPLFAVVQLVESSQKLTVQHANRKPAEVHEVGEVAWINQGSANGWWRTNAAHRWWLKYDAVGRNSRNPFGLRPAMCSTL